MMPKRLKNLIPYSLFLIPCAAGAAAPIVVGAIAGVAAIAGFSIYRSVAPVSITDSMNFFSSCWSCHVFGDVMGAMSELLPRVYDAVGGVMIPVAVSLTAIWFAWRLFSGYINGKPDTDAWGVAGAFGNHLAKLGLVVALLAFPLPRLISTVAIEPIFNIGLSLNRVVAGDEKFNECLVATTVANADTADAGLPPEALAKGGAYSPKLRNNLACELGNIHQLTAVGMTSGWTMMNMSFNSDYMYKIAGIPVFPNVLIMFAGLMILVLFFAALLPIPIYFLEIFIKLSLDLIMLPLYLLGWLFKDFDKIIPGHKSIIETINDVIKGTFGIALIGIFVSFAVMFLNAMFGQVNGISALAAAFANDDSQVLMDGLTMNNDSVVMIVLMGLFIAMFMVMIPKLINALFSEIDIDKNFEYVKDWKDNIKKISGNIKKWYDGVRKAASGDGNATAAKP